MRTIWSIVDGDGDGDEQAKDVIDSFYTHYVWQL